MEEKRMELDVNEWMERYTDSVVQKVRNMRLPYRHKYPKFTCKDFNGEIDILRHTEPLNSIPHRQNYLEMIYVRKGHAYFSVEGSIITIPENSFFLVSTVQLHTDYIDSDSEVYHILVNTDPFLRLFLSLSSDAPQLASFFTNILLNPKQTKYLFYQVAPESQLSVEDFFEDALRTFRLKDSQYIPVLKCQIALFLLQVSSHFSYTEADRQTGNDIDPLADRVFKYISTHYPTVTLKEVAEHFNYNSDYISRLLKQSYGGSFKQILTKVRMDQAEILLSKTQFSITEISRLVGYGEPVSFQNAFRKTFGCTPKQYRLQTFQV